MSGALITEAQSPSRGAAVRESIDTSRDGGVDAYRR